MSEFFRPYEGSGPFIFVSYAHKNSSDVLDTIRPMHDKGIRLWYDEGIPAGSDWPSNIARHMNACEAVLFFLSEYALESKNCFSEVRTGYSLNKTILVVHLDDSKPEGEWEEILSSAAELSYVKRSADREAAIMNSGFIGRRFFSRWFEKINWLSIGLAASVLLFLASGISFAAIAAGLWSAPRSEKTISQIEESSVIQTPRPTVFISDAEKYFSITFPDSQQSDAVHMALGLPKNDSIMKYQLAGISELYFAGNLITEGFDSISFDTDGRCRVNYAPVITGKVSDLSLFKNALSLERLALVSQPVSDAGGLSELRLLRELSIAGCPVSDLSSLGNLPSLEIIHIEHTSINDLRPLEKLPGLKAVTVSRDMLPLSWSDSAVFSVILVS